MLSTRSPRRRLALAAGALALLAVAPAARATIPATVTDYSVDAELAAHYEQHVQPPDGVGEFASSFTISELLPKVTFTDHGLTSSGTASTTVSSVESSAYMETHTPSGTVSATCTGNQTEPIMGPNIHSPLVGALGEESLVLRPFEDLILLWTCTGPSTFPSALLLPNVEEPNGEAPFNVVFTLPDEATSSGKVIQLVNKDVPFEKCPLRNPSTTTCTLHLQGQITFVRTGQRTVQVEAQPVDPTDIQPVPLARR
jgi:hypothetical protein